VTPEGAPRARLNPLPAWQRWTVIASALSLVVSGLGWLPLHHLWGAGAGELPNPLEAWILRWHGLSAVVGIFAAGVVSSGHVGRGWRTGSQRPSGLLICVLGGATIATGAVLSYLVSEGWRPGIGWAHAALGLAAFLAGLAHGWRRSRSNGQRAPGS
jgi:hypothetical protein